MPLDLENANTMYLMGRVVALLEGAYPSDPNKELNAGLLDALLMRPATAFPLVLKKFRGRATEQFVARVIAKLPADLPRGPVDVEDQAPYWMGYYHQRGQDQQDIKIMRKFTPDVLRRVGEVLFGFDHWQAEMTRALGLEDSSRVRAWISDNPSKRRSVPPDMCRTLLALLRQRSSESRDLADKIDGADKMAADAPATVETF